MPQAAAHTRRSAKFHGLDLSDGPERPDGRPPNLEEHGSPRVGWSRPFPALMPVCGLSGPRGRSHRGRGSGRRPSCRPSPRPSGSGRRRRTWSGSRRASRTNREARSEGRVRVAFILALLYIRNSQDHGKWTLGGSDCPASHGRSSRRSSDFRPSRWATDPPPGRRPPAGCGQIRISAIGVAEVAVAEVPMGVDRADLLLRATFSASLGVRTTSSTWSGSRRASRTNREARSEAGQSRVHSGSPWAKLSSRTRNATASPLETVPAGPTEGRKTPGGSRGRDTPGSLPRGKKATVPAAKHDRPAISRGSGSVVQRDRSRLGVLLAREGVDGTR